MDGLPFERFTIPAPRDIHCAHETQFPKTLSPSLSSLSQPWPWAALGSRGRGRGPQVGPHFPWVALALPTGKCGTGSCSAHCCHSTRCPTHSLLYSRHSSELGFVHWRQEGCPQNLQAPLPHKLRKTGQSLMRKEEALHACTCMHAPAAITLCI